MKFKTIYFLAVLTVLLEVSAKPPPPSNGRKMGKGPVKNNDPTLGRTAGKPSGRTALEKGPPEPKIKGPVKNGRTPLIPANLRKGKGTGADVHPGDDSWEYDPKPQPIAVRKFGPGNSCETFNLVLRLINSNAITEAYRRYREARRRGCSRIKTHTDFISLAYTGGVDDSRLCSFMQKVKKMGPARGRVAFLMLIRFQFLKNKDGTKIHTRCQI